MGIPRSPIFDIVASQHAKPITFWLLGLGSYASDICCAVHELTQKTEEVPEAQDDLGLAQYLASDVPERRVVKPGVSITCITSDYELAGRALSERDQIPPIFQLLPWERACDFSNIHNYHSPRHCRSCVRAYYSESGRDKDVESFVISNRPTSDGGPLVPLVLVQSEEPYTVLLQQILKGLSTNDDQSQIGRRVTAPIVALLQSNYPHRSLDTEGLINSIALQSEIFNRKLGTASTSTASTKKMKDSGYDVLYLAISNLEGNFESLVARFISENVLDTQELRKVLDQIHENESSVDRWNVVSASIPKIRLWNSGFTIPDIDDDDTALEDDQRHLLNNQDTTRPEVDQRVVEDILHSMRWSDQEFTRGLPMRDDYLQHVLIGYVLDGSAKIEAGKAPLKLVAVIEALASAMVMYGPFGFTETESFDWAIKLDTEIADGLRLMGKESTSERLANSLRSESGQTLRELLMNKENELANHCKHPRSTNPSARDFAELDFARALIRVFQSVKSGDTK
jgi:hypothetical protein